MRPCRDRQAGAVDTSPEAILALPTLDELGVTEEMVEAVEGITDASDVLGVERYRLENALRLLLFLYRKRVLDL